MDISVEVMSNPPNRDGIQQGCCPLQRIFRHYMKQVYLILAAMMLLCLAPMPYGYFQLVRFVAMVVFAVMAYQYYEQEKMPLTIVFGALALLFQPFIKIALGRTIWNIVDVFVAALLIILFIKTKKK